MHKMALAAAMLLLWSAGAAAQGTHQATQVVTFEVRATSKVSMSGSPTLAIGTATARSAPAPATESGTYAITATEASGRMTAQLDTAMPSGLTLKVSLAAPAGATSAGAVALGTTAQDVVTGISTPGESGRTIAYTLSGTAAAGVATSAPKTVTFTFTAGA